MTCHHRAPVFSVPGMGYTMSYGVIRHHLGLSLEDELPPLLPMVTYPERRRCRCVVTSEPKDHCHQVANAEDMICGPCREICFVENPAIFTIDVPETLLLPCTGSNICADVVAHGS